MLLLSEAEAPSRLVAEHSLVTYACAELMAEARVMDQLSSGDSSSDSNSSSSSSSEDSSSGSDSEEERAPAPAQTSAPANHSMPIISTVTESNNRHQESGAGLMNTLSE